jgi:transcriptional regulator with XRE-family HTH domain
MVRDLSETPGFADEFEKQLAGRRLIQQLLILRARAGLSQQEVAEKLACTQSKVSKLETSADADISFGDLVGYTAAVGHEMRLFLVPKGLKLADEVKMHAFSIRRLLDRMVQLAGDDGTMTAAVATFLTEAALNFVDMVTKAATALPTTAGESASPLQVQAVEMEAEGERRAARTSPRAVETAETAC